MLPKTAYKTVATAPPAQPKSSTPTHHTTAAVAKAMAASTAVSAYCAQGR